MCQPFGQNGTTGNAIGQLTLLSHDTRKATRTAHQIVRRYLPCCGVLCRCPLYCCSHETTCGATALSLLYHEPAAISPPLYRPCVEIRFDVALWATISDFPYSWPLWQRYASKFTATSLVGAPSAKLTLRVKAIGGPCTVFVKSTRLRDRCRRILNAIQALSPESNPWYSRPRSATTWCYISAVERSSQRISANRTSIPHASEGRIGVHDKLRTAAALHACFSPWDWQPTVGASARER